jgi:MOSC domain-containing protein YiiM
VPSAESQLVVSAIHLAPASRLPMRSVDSVTAEAGRGLVGDRYHGSKHRHVTVQSATALAAAEAAFGSPIGAAATRRNITISGGEVPATPGTRFTVGGVDLEVVRVAAPCKLLDDTIGRGAKDALRRRAGSVCRVLTTGQISVGDEVALDPRPPAGRERRCGSGPTG